MVITLNLEHLEELAKLKAYAERKNITIDEIIDKAVIKLASKLNDPQKEVPNIPKSQSNCEKLEWEYVLNPDRIAKPRLP